MFEEKEICKHKNLMVYNSAESMYICICNKLFEVKPSEKLSMFDPRVQEMLSAMRKEA